MITTAEEHTRKFHDILEKAKRHKFGHEYGIYTCDIPKEPGMCLVFQLDKETNKIGMTLLGREGAEAFSILSPINERLVMRYKNTEEFKEKRKLYVNG
jgi:hypothetical protein